MATLSDPVTDLDHIRGPEGALVTVVEYGDYECVASGYAHYIIKQLMQDLGDKVRFVYRNFPLTQIRPNALPAALAAEASGTQERFWDMHDVLFEYQDALEPEHLLVYAQVLGLDIERFIVDMTSDRMAARIRHDFVSGIRSGVDVTPTFFINNHRHEGLYDYEILWTAISKELQNADDQRKAKRSKRTPAISRHR